MIIMTYYSIHFLQCRLFQSSDETDTVEVSVNETINIFSLASGHLYERFLR